MAVVVSEGRLAAVQPGPVRPGFSASGLRLYDEHFASYAALFRTQPSVRRVISFLARNIAQLGLPTYRRVDDNDRQRLTDHPMARLIAQPNPWTTRYRLFDSLIHDLGIYDNAYWVKIPTAVGIRLIRITPGRMYPSGDTWFKPERYEIRGSRGTLTLDASEVVHFRGYNPEDAVSGLSPLETLRRVLAEEQAMGDYREGLWRNGARVEGILSRPTGAPKMSQDAKDRFFAQFQAKHAGAAGSGIVAILEEGMTYQQANFSAKDAQYLDARKLNTEEVAAAYHVPLPMVGILDHATFSNITEQHKQLYQDTLGPRLVEIEEEIGLQLLPDVPDSDRVYVEFNLAEKLRGSFEEQATQLQTSVGAPWLTRNEARARVNLPALPGGDELVTPMNVLTGGQASPTDSAPPPKARGMKAAERPDDAHLSAHVAAIRAHFLAQQAAADDGDDLTGDSWTDQLAETLLPLGSELAADVGGKAAERFGGRWSTERAAAYLALNAYIGARNINETTAGQLAQARDVDNVDGFWQGQIEDRADEVGQARVDNVSQFADHEGARQGGATSKSWRVTSSRPRSTHAALDGESVPIDDNFSNGLRWPRDASSSNADEVAGCTCELDFTSEAP